MVIAAIMGPLTMMETGMPFSSARDMTMLLDAKPVGMQTLKAIIPKLLGVLETTQRPYTRKTSLSLADVAEIWLTIVSYPHQLAPGFKLQNVQARYAW
jgi:hypothetical protein